jgi:hypothetical protein
MRSAFGAVKARRFGGMVTAESHLVFSPRIAGLGSEILSRAVSVGACPNLAWKRESGCRSLLSALAHGQAIPVFEVQICHQVDAAARSKVLASWMRVPEGYSKVTDLLPF